MTQGKDFEVLVCETAPQFKGHKTAKSLQEEGIDAKLITDSSVYALMSGVDKVIISTHAIMANGGLLAHSGAYQICLAAKVSIFYTFISFRNSQSQSLWSQLCIS